MVIEEPWKPWWEIEDVILFIIQRDYFHYMLMILNKKIVN